MINESDVSIISRLSIHHPSKDKLVVLVLYHGAINDRECIELHFNDDHFALQRRVASLGRQIKHMLSVELLGDYRVVVRLYTTRTNPMANLYSRQI